MDRIRTPSQTVGPYLAIALPWEDGPWVVPPETHAAFWIRGSLLDGAGDPVPDGLVETWQADTRGDFAVAGTSDLEPKGFRGLGRSATDADGAWQIHTVKPGVVSTDGGRPQAPHIDVMIFARGLLKHLVTRIYFADEELANAADPVLGALRDPQRRATLLARPEADGYRFDIHLQGSDETAFFHV